MNAAKLARFGRRDALRQWFVMSYDSGDKWGSVVGALFECSMYLYDHGDGPPEEWNFRTGASGGGWPAEEYSTLGGVLFDDAGEPIADCDDVERLGETLQAWSGRLEAAGISY